MEGYREGGKQEKNKKVYLTDKKNEKLFADNDVYSNVFVLTDMYGDCARKRNVTHYKDRCD